MKQLSLALSPYLQEAFPAVNYQPWPLQTVWQTAAVPPSELRCFVELAAAGGFLQICHDCHSAGQIYSPLAWSEFQTANT